MLESILTRCPGTNCIGNEYEQKLVDYGNNLFQHSNIKRGDIQKTDFCNENFDIAVVTAVLEHVPDLKGAMAEIWRILKPNGLLIVTMPDLFWEKIATMVGHLEDDKNNEILNMKKLKALFISSAFNILDSKKTMPSPLLCLLYFPFAK